MAREVKILLVDDEPTILRALQTALESHHYQVSAVTSGEQAVAKTASLAPDLVLLDLGLPGIDGFEVIRRIRTFAPTLPIVVVSAHGDDVSKVPRSRPRRRRLRLEAVLRPRAAGPGADGAAPRRARSAASRRP